MYNTLIRGFANSENPENSICTYIGLRREINFWPDSFSFAFMLKAAANLRCLASGFQLHCESIKYGLNTHVFVGTTLTSMYGECGCLEYARMVFDEMSELNVVSWNAILTACFRCDDVKGGEEIFQTMPFRDLTSWNVVLAGYSKASELELAENLFVKMPVKDDVSWSSMIVGCAHNGFFVEAFSYFRGLLRASVRPNEVSLSGVLFACAQSGAFNFGKVLHGYIEKGGFVWISSINNALLDMYAKCGNVGMARLVFNRMTEKTVVSWTSMIAALAMQGLAEEAIQLFCKMENSGVISDEITFLSILYACSHAGLIEKGCEYFSSMRENYGIEPSIEHYGCMVDLYGRAGQLQKAYEFVCEMPTPPNVVIWRTLLGACMMYNNVELAEQIKERLSELDPNSSGDYVLLSNIYAISGRWNDVAVIRKSMIDKRMKKAPGWSIIEIDKVMYSFFAGQMRDEVTEEAYEKLGEIISKIVAEGGYMAQIRNVLHDIEEEEKEDALSKHSEKLAVAFGIARSCKGGAIRIVKNLRICQDCHIVMKMISKVYGVKIVVRDRSRFHSFGGGACSCGDFW